MTKKQMQNAIELLVEAIAEAHGAKVVDTAMTVGGRATTVREAQGGMFDLDGARRLLSHRLTELKQQLTAKMGA